MEVRYKKIVEDIKLTPAENNSIADTLNILYEIIRTIGNENDDKYCEELYVLADKAKDALNKFYYDDRVIARFE